MGYIYKITNKIDKKMYIGQTKRKNPLVRWKSHLYDCARNRGCPVLGNAMRKHGIDSFEFEILIECPDEECNTLEIKYISDLNTLAPNGYNAHIGGKPGGSFKGLTHTPAVRAVIGEKSRAYHARPGVREIHSESRRNFYKDPEKREAHSKVMKIAYENIHYKPSVDTKQKISDSLLNYYSTQELTEEQKKKHSEAMIKAIGRPVYQYSLDDTFIAEYECIKGAADALGIQRKAVQACLSGRSKTSGGFKWKYADK